MICKDMAKQGYRPEQLVHALEKASPGLGIRKVGHQEDYCKRTVSAVFKNPKIKNYLERQKQKQRGSSLGL